MSLIKLNSAEGGTNGVAVTNGNSGGASGDAFPVAVSIVGSGASVYSNAFAAHGSMSFHVTGGSGDALRMYYGDFGVGNTGFALRCYFMLAALPNIAMDIIYVQNNVPNNVVTIGLTSANKITVQDDVSLQFTATAALTTGVWYRLECQAAIGTISTGTLKFQYYLGDSTTPIETFSTSSANVGTSWIYRAAFGKQSTGGTLDAYYDDLAVSTQNADPIGPHGTVLRRVSNYNSAEGGVAGAALTLLTSGDLSGNPFDTYGTGTGTITFASAPAYTGRMSYAVNPGSGSGCSIGYYTSSVPTITIRLYVCLTAYPSGATQFVRVFGTGVMGNLLVTGASKFSTQDAVGTIAGSGGSVNIPLNTWVRVEQTITVGATTSTGYIHNSAFIGDSLTPMYDYQTSTANTGSVNPTRVDFGKVSNAGDWGMMYFDDISVQDTTYIGPVNTASGLWLSS